MRSTAAIVLGGLILGCACAADPGADEGSTTTTDDGSTSDGSSSTAPIDDVPAGEDSSSSGEPAPVYDGEPLDVETDGEWHFVEVDGMACADGRASGVGVRRVEGSSKLAVYFKGGGACFNPTSCGLTQPLMLTGDDAMAANPNGILDFAHDDNPLLDFNVIYMPYCTGDIHAGARPAGTLDGLEDPWDFVGRANLTAALDRVVPTFPELDQLLVVGTSAGGIGAMVNFPVIAEAWPQTDTVLLDDSGLVFADGFLAPCLQRQLRDAWGLAEVLPTDCPSCSGSDGGGLVGMFDYVAQEVPHARLGVIASREDQILRLFYGFGADECAAAPGFPDLGEDVMAAAVDDLVGGVLTDRYRSFVVDGDVHVWSTKDQFYTVESGGTSLHAWVSALLEGDVEDVRP